MIDYASMIDFLKNIDNHLKEKMVLIAVGGTAILLMKLKESTKDIDFCIERKNLKDFEDAAKRNKNLFKIDLFADGYIFCLQLPDDYIKMSRPFKSNLTNIELKLLHPIDIIITKTARLNERDKEDISALIRKKKIKKQKLINRFNKIKQSYPASDKILKYNFNWMLREFFKS